MPPVNLTTPRLHLAHVLAFVRTQLEQLHMNKIQCGELPFDLSLVYLSFYLFPYFNNSNANIQLRRHAIRYLSV